MLGKFLNKKFNNVAGKAKGQTMIEAVVAIGVALVLITSVVALINASNRRTTLTRQANQASKLAQEGMEIVRNIRDRKGLTVRVGSKAGVACTTAVPCSWDELS